MAADPVADKTGFLCAYMSAHPDTLVAYVKHFGKIKGDVSSAKMLSIDSKVRILTKRQKQDIDEKYHAQGMDLEYKMKGSPASIKPQVVRVDFDPALLGYEEVKPRLLGMKADADEALGTVRENPYIRFQVASPTTHSSSPFPKKTVSTTSQVKAPQITHFELPFQIWITTSLLLLLIYATSMPPDSHGKFWWLARTLRPGIFPDWTIRPLWWFVYVAHSVEGFYAVSLARKHHMPWHIAVSVPPRHLPAQPRLTWDFADGLGRLGHDIWLPCAVEAAPSNPTSANRVDYEG
jgi:hypothetical protein